MFRFTPGCCCVLGSGSDSGSESGSESGSSGSEELSGSSGSAGSIEQGSLASGSDSGSSGSDSGSDESGSDSGSLASGSSGSDESGSSGSESGSESGSSGSRVSGSSGSEPDDVQTTCCGERVKKALALNILSSICPDAPVGAYPGTYEALFDRWNFDTGDIIFSMSCQGDNWQLVDSINGTACIGFNQSETSSTCSPLAIAFSDANWSFLVTE